MKDDKLVEFRECWEEISDPQRTRRKTFFPLFRGSIQSHVLNTSSEVSIEKAAAFNHRFSLLVLTFGVEGRLVKEVGEVYLLLVAILLLNLLDLLGGRPLA